MIDETKQSRAETHDDSEEDEYGSEGISSANELVSAINVEPLEVVPRIPNYSASEGDSSFIDESGEKIEQDEQLARVMAWAGHHNRSLAAEYRSAIRFINTYSKEIIAAGSVIDRLNRVDELSTDPRFTGDHYETTGFDLKEFVEEEVAHYPSTMERLHSWQNTLAKRAREADEIAEHEEAWAKALYLHPPSPAFKQAYPYIELSPYQLHILADRGPSYNRWLSEQMRGTADSEASETNREGIRRRIQNPYRGNSIMPFRMRVFELPQSALSHFQEQLQALDNSPLSTEDNYKKLYLDVINAGADYLETQANEIPNALEDIRNGKAADSNYEKPAENRESLISDDESAS